MSKLLESSVSLRIDSTFPDTTLLSIIGGHFLTILDHVLGGFSEIVGTGTIRFPTGQYVDEDGKPTGEVSHSTVHDQVAISGVLRGAHEGALASVVCRAGIPCSGEQGRGRRMFQWIIDGEQGSIEIANRESDGQWGAFFTLKEKDVYLNGEKVELELEATEFAQLGQAGRAWLEFAKGEEGKYTTMEDAVRLHRAVDAAQTSILEGRRIVL